MNALRPNGVLSAQAMTLLVAVYAVAALAWWALHPAGLLPRPWEVLAAGGDLWRTGGLGVQLWQSLTVNLQALALTAAVSLGLAYVSVLPAARPVVAFVSKLRFLGLTGLTLIFTLLAGSAHVLKVLVLAFGMTVFFVTSMAEEVTSTPIARYDHARTLRMGEWRVVWEVLVLGKLDRAVEILRQNAAMGWMMLTMVEGLVRSEGGIGALLLTENKHLHLAAVFAIQLAILAVGLGQDYAIGLCKQALCPWAALATRRA